MSVKYVIIETQYEILTIIQSLSYIRAIIARVDKQKQRGQDLATSTGSNTHKTRSNSRHESKKSIKTSGGKRTKRRTRDGKCQQRKLY
jgi:hypothetical protein